jgi:RNA polymerase sigma factor (sigma-70 family)
MNTIPSAAAASEQALVDCLPSLHRWAHNRVPPACRGRFDARDLVQEAVVRTWPRLRHLEMRHSGALAGYLRQAVMNIVRDEARRTARRPVAAELPENIAGGGATPLEALLRSDHCGRCRSAMKRLSAKDRRLLVARVIKQHSTDEVVEAFGFRTAAAARMAVNRAFSRFTSELRSAGEEMM